MNTSHSTALLYQFSFSHFCEKARWALDYKAKPYTVRNLLPGQHIIATRGLTQKPTVPILLDKGRAIQGSDQIISYLDEQIPQRPLTPHDATARAVALEFEAFLAEAIGVNLRLYFYFYALQDTPLLLSRILADWPTPVKWVYPWVFPLIGKAMWRGMGLSAARAEAARVSLEAALAKLDGILQQQPFLTGNAFNRVDLTACALLSPLVLARGPLPQPLLQLREQYQGQRVFNWVTDVYRQYRGA